MQRAAKDKGKRKSELRRLSGLYETADDTDSDSSNFDEEPPEPAAEPEVSEFRPAREVPQPSSGSAGLRLRRALRQYYPRHFGIQTPKHSARKNDSESTWLWRTSSILQLV